VRAVLMTAYGVRPDLVELPDPVPPADGVVVAVEATGLCRSDWHGLMGHDSDVTLPHVPGHEFAGTVAAVGSEVRGWSVGDRVTAPFVNGCGRCAICLGGDHQVCPDQAQPGFTHDGSFAEYVVVHRAATNLVRLPDEVSAVAAASLGCRFATAFRGVVEVGRGRPGEWVVVHGCGGVGLSAVMIAANAGMRVIAVDASPAALDRAQSFGAEVVLPAGDSVVTAVRDLTGGGAHLSLDAVGTEATCSASIAGLRRRGRHVQIGLLPPALGWPAVPMHLVIAYELEVLGSHGMSPRGYPGLLGLVTSGRLDPGALVTERIGLADVPDALVAMGAPAAAPGITVALPSLG
jgi:D-arabinose 1-dehydrogenase-like Zn-dependent alcohol dehydrogenase